MFAAVVYACLTVVIVISVSATAESTTSVSVNVNQKSAIMQSLGICAKQQSRPNLANSTVPELKKLAEYESVCGGQFATEQMLFTSMPTNADEAHAMASDMTAKLKELSLQGLAPLVVFEPPDLAGQGYTLRNYSQGTFDGALQGYYQTLKSLGITDKIMGTWVLFPEANTPTWVTTNASDFVANVKKVAGLQKQYFPASKVSILLNNQTFSNNDPEWNTGRYASLLPYVNGLPRGLIDSFGYQGFPWLPAANKQGIKPIEDASVFLQAGLAIEAAKALGVHDIWLNTGTFNKSHTQSPATTAIMPLDTRKQILGQITNQAQELKRAGFAVSVNLFSQNKSATAEAVDWSYWDQGKASQGSATSAFTDFAHSLVQDGIGLSVYDTMNGQ